jgi:hypothetical protein
MEFPIYRKYKGIDVWFKILSNSEFIEYKKLGKKLITHEIVATIFPEKQFIQDMISYHDNRWIEVFKEELNEFIKT